jgi:hypothetical protein
MGWHLLNKIKKNEINETESTDRYDSKKSNTCVPNGFEVQLRVVVSHFTVVPHKLRASVHVTQQCAVVQLLWAQGHLAKGIGVQ